jgi:hypothetical protein
MLVDELEPVMTNLDLIVYVSSVTIVSTRKRQDGTQIRLCEAIVGDDSGCVST